MKKYKVEYEKMYDDKSLDSIASLEHIIVEAKDKNDAEEIAEEKIYRLPKQDFDSLNIIFKRNKISMDKNFEVKGSVNVGKNIIISGNKSKHEKRENKTFRYTNKKST